MIIETKLMVIIDAPESLSPVVVVSAPDEVESAVEAAVEADEVESAVEADEVEAAVEAAPVVMLVWHCKESSV
jgi:hypothetical protein